MKKILFSLFTLFTVSLLPVAVFAQAGGGLTTGTVSPTNSPALLNKLKDIGGRAGYDSAGTDGSTLVSIIGTVVNAALGLLGVIFILLIIYAGFRWMTAGGDEEQIKKSGATIRSAIIGLLIVIGSFAIWLFISNIFLDGASTSAPATPSTPGGSGSLPINRDLV